MYKETENRVAILQTPYPTSHSTRTQKKDLRQFKKAEYTHQYLLLINRNHMEGSSHFNVPRQETDAANFLPHTELPAHLAQYEKIAKTLRAQMTPVMKAVLELTDKTALRSAALPQSQ